MSKYIPRFALELPNMFKHGESLVEVCDALEITEKTFYEWCRRYPEFAKAYQKGIQKSKAWWIKNGRKGTFGKCKVNSTMFSINMRNQFGWRENVEISTDMNIGTPENPAEELKKRGIPLPQIPVDDAPDAPEKE